MVSALEALPRPAVAGVPCHGRHPHLVGRPHLLARLDAEEAPLTMVSAPAGWGKTTLLEAWMRSQRGRVLWVAGGNSAGFWRRVMTAVATTTPVPPEVIDSVG